MFLFNMEETIYKIQEELRAGRLVNDPHQCAEFVASLSGELSFYLSQLAELEKNKPADWLVMRKEHKSDNATEKAWERTERGIEAQWFRSRIKRINALLVGLKTLLKMAEMEMRNLSK